MYTLEGLGALGSDSNTAVQPRHEWLSAEPFQFQSGFGLLKCLLLRLRFSDQYFSSLAGPWIRVYFFRIRIQLIFQCGSKSSFKNLEEEKTNAVPCESGSTALLTSLKTSKKLGKFGSVTLTPCHHAASHLTFSCRCMQILWNCPSTGDMMSPFISMATCWGSTDSSSRS